MGFVVADQTNVTYNTDLEPASRRIKQHNLEDTLINAYALFPARATSTIATRMVVYFAFNRTIVCVSEEQEPCLQIFIF